MTEFRGGENIYYRKQEQFPIVNQSKNVAGSDKLYYRNRFANPVIEHGIDVAISDKLYYCFVGPAGGIHGKAEREMVEGA